MAMRVCRKCRVEKELEEFINRKTCRQGKGHQCKQCDYEAYKKWRLENLDRYRELSRNSYYRNKKEE